MNFGFNSRTLESSAHIPTDLVAACGVATKTPPHSSIIVVHLISHILATPLHNISLMELLLSKWTKVGKNAISAFWLIEEKATIQMLRRLRLFLGPSWKTLGLCWALHVVKVSDSS